MTGGCLPKGGRDEAVVEVLGVNPGCHFEQLYSLPATAWAIWFFIIHHSTVI